MCEAFSTVPGTACMSAIGALLAQAPDQTFLYPNLTSSPTTYNTLGSSQKALGLLPLSFSVLKLP